MNAVMIKDIVVELKISYFSAASYTSVEYYVEGYANSIDEAEELAKDMVQEAMIDAEADDAMMDTFYYEYDYIMDQSTAEKFELKFEKI